MKFYFSKQQNVTHRNLKDLQYMDQSLRTVATQLLNVTSPQEVIKVHNKEFTKIEHATATTLKSSSEESDTSSSIRDVSPEIGNSEPAGLSFGRPINSKFSYFESSHPGQAMAITEEELEREMSSTRLMNAYKNHPTTTGGISTWILLNPPSTTVKSVEAEKTKLQQPFQTEVRLTVRPSSSIDRVETVSQLDKTAEKSTPQLISSVITTEKETVITKKPTTPTTTKKITTTSPRPERENTLDSETLKSSSSTTTLKIVRTTPVSTSTSDETISSTTISTTKKNQGPRTTAKPKNTTPRTTKPITTKPTRPGQQGRPKPTTTKRTTVKLETTMKNETTASTGKIEKVTFKPVPIITTPQNKPENTEKPIFVTKIKASMLMDNQKTPITPTSPSTTAILDSDLASKTDLSGMDLVEVPVRSKPSGTKGNNVLKVQLKKPEETTQIEIEPIKVNTPVLKIEKLDKDKVEQIVEKDMDNLNNSKIDLQFDFNTELTKINVDTQTEVAATSTSTTSTTSSTATTSTTTKRPRHNSKRKKNKSRRRKPSTTSTAPSSTTVATIVSALMETNEGVTDPTVLDNAIQESKIAPDTKVTKNKKKQPQKAISTQIYNFLSREVMPSFGVMSLVGLGLGLASYFLYPFGGTISRRNYEVEPNYKYNPEEYGGNYGQNEEEVLSKVFQGMTNHENKYPGANSNYYHYQHYDGAYDTQTTKRTDARYPSISTSPVHRTMENTQPGVKYRNTDFRYAEVQTTPVYYDRKHADLAAEAAGSANRQFVVGNVPKEYPFETVKAAALPVQDSKNGVNYVSTEIGQTQFERDIAQGLNFLPNSVDVHNYGGQLLDASTVRSDDGYEEIEITPTAVAVEHGPRALKVKRAVTSEAANRRSRSKRESVIQVIPSKHELEEEREEAEKEEDLSNEILDIIDSALPGGDQRKTKNTSEENEVEDFEGQRKKQKESFTKNPTTMKNVENTTNILETSSSTSKTVEQTKDDLTTSSQKTSSDGETHSESTTSNPKDTKATTVEWFDDSTTKKPAEGFSLFDFVKKVAEIKFRLGLTILKHASEGFARYLGHVQKRINGEE